MYISERCLEIMIVQCAVESLLIALDLHIANHKAVTNICMALSSIVEINGKSYVPFTVALTSCLPLMLMIATVMQ